MGTYNAQSLDLGIKKLQLTHGDRFADLLEEWSLTYTLDNFKLIFPV